MKNKVLMIIPSYYPAVGGAERQLMGLAKELNLYGVKIDVVTRRINHSPELEEIDGYNVIRLFSRVPRLGFLIQLLFFILKSHSKYRVIHVHTLNSPAILCAFFAKLLDIPVLVKVTRSGKKSQLSRYAKSSFGKFFFNILKKNTYFVAITPDVFSELITLGAIKDQIFSIPNGVSKQKNLDKDFHVIKIVFLGRLIKRKRAGLLIKSFKNIKKPIDCKLYIVGDGPERSNLEKLVVELNLENSCSFLGSMSHSESLKILSDSNIFVLPSDSEGMSNALLEAMAASNAVIAADIPANHALVQHNINGMLFNDNLSLSAQLEEVVNDPIKIKSLGFKAKETIDSQLSFSIIGSAYKNAYDVLCSTK
ncbi:glycosyltransferase family 4 protein [Gammaproteobacteria bacterium]|nr:glycosyltransferase family 4 protein [Gammaproteobacteria bacterium]